MDVNDARAAVVATLWSRLSELARTNAIAANAMSMRRLYEDDVLALLTCLVSSVESNEQLLERARNLIALMPPPQAPLQVSVAGNRSSA